MDAKLRASRHAQQQAAWQAWHTAVLPLLKKIPSLEELLGRPAERRAAQTAEEMDAAGRAWAASFAIH